MAIAQKKNSKVEARDTVVVVVGARPIEYVKRIVRDRHTGKLVEIDIHEVPPVDEGDEGIPYVFKAGEKVRRDHPAVEACPGAFREIEDD
jgi:hypothetical protein